MSGETESNMRYFSKGNIQNQQIMGIANIKEMGTDAILIVGLFE